MVKTRMAVGGQAGRCLNSPEFQKIYKKGFSIAEALVALLIGSLILGMSAPLITKQLKHNNFSDVQVQVLSRKLEQINNQLSIKNNEIEELRQQLNNIDTSSVPKNAVVFFNGACPEEGWEEAPAIWANHFLMIKNSSDTSRDLASVELDSIPNITGTANIGQNSNNNMRDTVGDENAFYTGGVAKYDGIISSDSNNQLIHFDASRSAKVYGRLEHGDLRPKNVALIACIKTE